MRFYTVLATSQTVLIVKYQLPKKRKLLTYNFRIWREYSDSHSSEDSQSCILTTQNEINPSLYNPERFGSTQQWLGTTSKHKLVVSKTGSVAPCSSQFELELMFYQRNKPAKEGRK